MTQLTRRDLLKLLALTSASLAARPLVSRLDAEPDSAKPHIIVFVFDAWTAANVQIFGYPRQTMPNLEKFAERCFVYQNHYSAGSFTVPGTASLLTGLYPWDHRAIQLTAGGIAPIHKSHNVFAALERSRSGIGYAQNPYADLFLSQFKANLTKHIPQYEFNLEDDRLFNLPIFKNDPQIAFASFESNIIRGGKGMSGSLYYGLLSRLASLNSNAQIRRKYFKQYPFGLPLATGYFLLNGVTDGIRRTIHGFDSPSMSYFHLFPPHEPYAPRREFTKLFNDNWDPQNKPIHPLSRARHTRNESLSQRLRYDQYLATWDAEFARVIHDLETSGMLDKSVVVITSDHGELFERGELGHNTRVLSSPVVHVPLLISLPGQTQRKDFTNFTSSLDLLPTLAHLTGDSSPAWGDGHLLPSLGGEEDLNRSIFSFDAKSASSFAAIERLSMSAIKQGYRLIYYQYSDYTGFEFYDMLNDPEELKDLFPSAPKLALQMKDELLQTIADFNRPYLRS